MSGHDGELYCTSTCIAYTRTKISSVKISNQILNTISFVLELKWAQTSRIEDKICSRVKRVVFEDLRWPGNSELRVCEISLTDYENFGGRKMKKKIFQMQKISIILAMIGTVFTLVGVCVDQWLVYDPIESGKGLALL